MSKILKVGNLAPSVTMEGLKDVCTEFGQVAEVRIAESPFSGISRGFGYVQMSSESEAAACVGGLNERVHEGRKLTTSSAPADQFKKLTRRSR